MNLTDISTMRRFIGMIEGVAVGLPDSTQILIFDYIEVVDKILDREEKEGEE